MNHLTDEQLAGWLAGEADLGTQTHLQNCEHCQAEATALRHGISRYTLVVRQESASAQSLHMPAAFAPRKALMLHRLRWAGAGVLALLLAVQTAWIMKPGRVATTSHPAASATLNSQRAGSSQPTDQMSDDELLEAVNNDLNRDVPQALAPVSEITTARNKIAAASIDTVSK
jgi:hypothetical protein